MASEEKQKKRDPNNPCLFCTDPQGVSLSRELAYSARDTYGVSPGHTLVIPKKEVDYLFDLEDDLYAGLQLFAKKVANYMMV